MPISVKPKDSKALGVKPTISALVRVHPVDGLTLMMRPLQLDGKTHRFPIRAHHGTIRITEAITRKNPTGILRQSNSRPEKKTAGGQMVRMVVFIVSVNLRLQALPYPWPQATMATRRGAFSAKKKLRTARAMRSSEIVEIYFFFSSLLIPGTSVSMNLSLSRSSVLVLSRSAAPGSASPPARGEPLAGVGVGMLLAGGFPFAGEFFFLRSKPDSAIILYSSLIRRTVWLAIMSRIISSLKVQYLARATFWSLRAS